jgi:phosphatidate cytidylyltransferase
MLHLRLISSVILWGLALGMLFYGSAGGCWILVTAFGLLAQWEFYSAQEKRGLDVYKLSGVGCGLLLFIANWFCLIERPAAAGWLPSIEGIIFILVIIGALGRLVISGQPQPNPMAGIALTLFGFFYVPYLFSYVARVAFWPGGWNDSRYVLIYLLAVTKFSDAGAYAVGSLWGKHKMIPRISPGKTWEGFVGGILASLSLSMLLIHCFAGRLPSFTLSDAIVLGILLPLASVIGDLAESVVKRDAQIKDSGRSIPGIGGALDLIDSLLFTAPLLYFYLLFTAKLA